MLYTTPEKLLMRDALALRQIQTLRSIPTCLIGVGLGGPVGLLPQEVADPVEGVRPPVSPRQVRPLNQLHRSAGGI